MKSELSLIKNSSIFQSWDLTINSETTYRVDIEGTPVNGSDISAVLEWYEAFADNDSARKNPLKRVFLDRTKTGWTGIHKSPIGATQLQVHLYQWPWEKSPLRDPRFEFSCEKTERPSKRLVKMAVAYHKLIPPITMEHNRQIMVDMIKEAGKQKVNLLCMCETFLDRRTGGLLADRAISLDGPELVPIIAAIQKANLYAVFSVNEKFESKFYNTAVLFSPKGERIGVYRNRIPAFCEKEMGIAPGDSFPVFDTPLGKIGMLICWDVIFPEAALTLARQGAEIICVPIGGAGEHWECLWKARAIDNQVFWLASTDSADCGGGPSPSAIVSPEGKILAETRVHNGLAIATGDISVRREEFWFGIGPSMGEVRNIISHSRPNEIFQKL